MRNAGGWRWMLAWWALAAVIVAMVCPPVSAQSSRRPPPAEIVSVDLGWNPAELARDRWQPAVVWITSRDKPFSGVLTVSFPQDAMQEARVVVGPVATTPGVVTPIEIAISPRVDTHEIVFTLENERFRTQHRFTKADSTLPRIGLGSSGLLLFVGDSSAMKALTVASAMSSPSPKDYQEGSNYSEERVWESMLPATTTPTSLPMSWGVYESLDVVIANASDIAKASPRSRAALATWVRAGGRLVLRVDAAGPAWPTFLPTDDANPPIVASPQQYYKAGDDLRQRLGRWGDSSFQARALSLTDEGRARGWVTLYSANAAEESEPGALAAYGPLGLGMVALVGFDPQHVAQLISDEQVKDLWRGIIRPLLPPHALLGGWQQYSYGMPTADWESTGAINAALDELAGVPPIGASIFWAIILCMFALVILLGPFDGLVLGYRRLSQYSWLTALLWIGIACVSALLAPRVMRSGETVMGRMVVTDRICDAAGEPVYTVHTGLTGVFAGKPLRLLIDHDTPGVWVRGISATEVYWRGSNPITLLPALPLMLTGDSEGEPLRTMLPGYMGVPQWTYRALCDTTPLLPARSGGLGAQVKRGDSGWRITVTNVPSEAVIEELVLQTSEGWHVLGGGGAPTADGRGREFTTDAPPFRPDLTNNIGSPALLYRWLRDRTSKTNSNYYYGYSQQNSLGSLPGVRERCGAIDVMLESGRWACVYAKVRGLPLDVTPDGIGNHKLNKTDYLRLLTPLEEAP
jgi:hypothetical protein